MQKRVFDETKLHLKIDDQIVQLATAECDAAYGARPLRRFIEREITTAVARLLLSGQAQIVTNQLTVQIQKDTIVISKAK